MARRRRTATHWGVFDVDVEDEEIARVRPLGEDREPSRLGQALMDAPRADCRVLNPAVRRGFLESGPRSGNNPRASEPFVEVSWDEALDITAHELERIRRSHGPEAVFGGSYGWASAGRFHHAQSQIHRFLRHFGGYTDKVNGYSFAAEEVILPRILGQTVGQHQETLPTWAELAEHTELVVAFGGLPLRNSQVNPGGVGRHVVGEAQRRCREAGVRFVSLSPLLDDTVAELEAEWLAPAPGTDTAIMMALAHTLIEADRHDREFLERCCVGFERLRHYLMGVEDGRPKDADWAARICGIPASRLRELAFEIASSRTFFTVTWSLQRAHHGEQPIWMGAALAAVAGQLGRRGGGFAVGYGCEHGIGTARSRPHVASLPQPPNPVETFIPVARISDMLLNPGATIDYDGQRVTYPEIRAVYWCGGNPFHHHQDLNKLIRAWQVPEVVIVHDAFWNPLARHADIVLPCTLALEREDFAAGHADRWLSAMHRVVDPPEGVRDDYEIFSELAARLNFGDAFTENRTAAEWVRLLYERTRSAAAEAGIELPEFEEFWETGEAAFPASPRSEWQFLRFREDPAGHPLKTPSGRVEIFSETIAGFGYPDCPGHPFWMEPIEWLGGPAAAEHPLHLLSTQPHNRLHSQHDHARSSQADKIHGREPVRINPADAGARGIATGDLVLIRNERGTCLAGANVTDTIRPGVVQLATGAWYDPLEPGTPGTLDLQGNPNVLTLDIGTSSLAQGPSAQTALVEVERYSGDAPAPRCYSPPTILARDEASTARQNRGVSEASRVAGHSDEPRLL